MAGRRVATIKDKIPYYTVRRNGRGFWEPKPEMRAAGFVSTPCGIDGPGARTHAKELNERWLAVKRGEVPAPALARKDKKLTPEQAEDLIPYRKGSLGAAFKVYRESDVWKLDKKERTREDWWRGWKNIAPVFAHKDPRTVTLNQISAFRSAIRIKHGVREAHRTVKIWRALWQVNALNGFCDKDRDPSKGFQNNAADPRNVFWLEAEALALETRAWELGYYGLAAVIAVAWDTQLSPVDVRTLRASQMSTAAQGEMFFTKRTKTDVPVGGLLTARSVNRLADYLEQLKIVMPADAFIFRNRSGAPYSKDTLGDDFRDVRFDLYGPDERRTLADFRRSGANEAIAGAVKAENLSHAMGNSLARCHALFKTYCPVNVVSLRAVADARTEGAKLLAQEQAGDKIREQTAPKIPESRNAPADLVGTAIKGGT
jgi:hypothetical protein